MTDPPVLSPDALRWGILGATSTVARQAVMPAMQTSASADVVAVASLSAGPSVNLDPALGQVRRYAEYEELLTDPNVEAVYIALPNSMHLQWVITSLDAGHHVLCEKPLALTAQDAKLMQSAAHRNGKFLMEAYMSPFHPRSEAIEALVSSGRLGELRFGRSAFTGVLDRPGDHRWRPEMGGGALLDVGIYCVAPMVQAAAGCQPVSVTGSAAWTTGGVDSSFSGWLEFDNGFCAGFEASFEAPERQAFELVGTEAMLRCTRAFTPGIQDQQFELVDISGSSTTMRARGGDCYQGMVEHFTQVVRQAAIPRRPLSASIALATTIDALMASAMDRRPAAS